MPSSVDLEIQPLSPDRLDDLLAYFDRDAFSDNAWWAGCYCNFYESLTHPANNPDPATPAFAPFRDHNRGEKAERIRSGRAGGFLAYRGRAVVGWLNAQPSAAYANPRQFGPAFANVPERTGMVMCFVVAPAARGEGVGTALLRAAIEDFRARGLRHAQGFARRPDAKQAEWETFATSNYHGTLSMYRENGFREVGSLGSYAVMRRDL
jgi:ribosomal protein S18 acetylase RimI-like enzyme